MDEFKRLRQELFDVKYVIAINEIRSRGTENRGFLLKEKESLIIKEKEIKKKMLKIKIDAKLEELGIEINEEDKNEKYKGR